MIICEHAESWKYFIYIPESSDNSFLTRSMCVAIPAFLTLALYFVYLPALFLFSQWARVTMTIFLFAMGVSYHGHFSFQFFSTTGWSYQHIFLFAMGWSYQHRFTHSNFSQVCAAESDFILFSFLALFLSPFANTSNTIHLIHPSLDLQYSQQHLRNRQPTILFTMDTILYPHNDNNNIRTITMSTITIKQQ
jgi:hypothetical protein